MFLEKRVYQGSSGKVYPIPVIDKVADVPTDKSYLIVFLENEFLQIQVMPEIGGRIYRALDKTNNYDFVYYNRVMKPALVGLAGPWVSGGIEFNWPQHHRPNTYGPVEYRIDDTAADSKTVWLSEYDRMYGTKVTTGITLRAGVAAIEISCELHNPTDHPQTFLWWANPAVEVHDETQSIFPPDVHAVMDHGKRDVSNFPIATGVYYKTDYSEGVDISRYKNIPVPTSYMAYHSDYDFVGGYDHRKGAGVLHIADHHISPGKKQWTWGNGEFGRAWDKRLTDNDGPYIELMTGVFTDNQPDFTWLAPHSGKNFTQYFLPYKGVGEVKCANIDITAGLDVSGGKATIRLYSPRRLGNAAVRLSRGGEVLFETETALSPDDVFEHVIATAAKEWELTLEVTAAGALTLRYTPAQPALQPAPDPAKAITAPHTLPNNEALLLAGQHLEQYRHATYDPEPYYAEGLRRDPGDIRLGNAYGNLLLRRGQFAEAQKLFEAAKATATRHNPTPYDGEVFYNLGKSLEYQGMDEAAYAAYYKSIWCDAWRSQGYLKLSQISARRGNFSQALTFAKEAMWANYKNFSARAAAAILMRLQHRADDAVRLLEETREFDPMDFVAARELEKITRRGHGLAGHLRGSAHNSLTLAWTYVRLGLYGDAAEILRRHLQDGEDYAMVHYCLAYCLQLSGDPSAQAAWVAAANASADYCFPNTLEEYEVLRMAANLHPRDAMAHYYLGCFLYDKKRYDDACDVWNAAAALAPTFPTVHRNLSLYYANKRQDYAAARKSLETAFALNRQDARVFYELNELLKKTGVPFAEIQTLMERHIDLVAARDDLSVAYAEILNGLGLFEKAIDLLMSRNFHPWEGGEGKVPTQHKEARIGLARKLIAAGSFDEALRHLAQATVYHPNFGEGKLAGTL
ncbi:MAG: DUF5107 domain-containing protein, partial [Defluviitaleaceae bacterium]|nr:DUF5107 domain-containing protein [Defluviitaleaceae bacterium]